MSVYTVQECKDRIEEIDQRLQELETKPQRQGVGPYQIGLAGKMSDLRKERQKWEKRLRIAKAEQSDGASVNGPSTSIH
ncbi:MAG: hypothetical protein ABEN55_09530 [Bradymonadaceae bacterium]